MLDNTKSADLAALLAWYREMGVDQAGRRDGHRLAGQGRSGAGTRLQGAILATGRNHASRLGRRSEPTARPPAASPARRPPPTRAAPRQFAATPPMRR